MDKPPQKLLLSHGDYIAYHQSKYKSNPLGIIFLGGFMSDMNGTKATYLEHYCQTNQLDFIRFDYFGHGQSSGNFSHGTIGLWKENCLTILDQLTDKPQILVGSSMGGWLMLLTALAHPTRIKGLIGIAAAPDFTEDLIWDLMTPAQKSLLMETGAYHLHSDYSHDPYPITKNLIEEARQHLLLKTPISINIPVHLLHGKCDDDVPPIISERLYERLTSPHKTLHLLEGGDHRMSSPEQLELLQNIVQKMYLNISKPQ